MIEYDYEIVRTVLASEKDRPCESGLLEIARTVLASHYFQIEN